MLRSSQRVLVLTALLWAAAAGNAQAQWSYGSYPGGYGGYGWGGWGGGGTIEGNVARGLGYYAQGVGQSNVETAQAASINTDTAMRWNEYWWQAQLAHNRAERDRLTLRQARDSGAGAAIEKRLHESPTDADITSGDALNAALDQLSNPRVHSSALKLATTKIPGKVIRKIPFVNASEAVTISLDQLTTEGGWPAGLKGAGFDDHRKAYYNAIHKALKEDTEGEISATTIKEVRDSLGKIKTALAANPPADRVIRSESENYLKALYGMTRMLERPDIEKVLAELDTIKETSLGNLLGFMQTFNLRFGRPTTPDQRLAYESLYPLVDDIRDKVVAGLDTGKDREVAKTNDAPPPPPKPFKPAEFFNEMKLDHLDGPHRVLDRSESK